MSSNGKTGDIQNARSTRVMFTLILLICCGCEENRQVPTAYCIEAVNEIKDTAIKGYKAQSELIVMAITRSNEASYEASHLKNRLNFLEDKLNKPCRVGDVAWAMGGEILYSCTETNEWCSCDKSCERPEGKVFPTKEMCEAVCIDENDNLYRCAKGDTFTFK